MAFADQYGLGGEQDWIRGGRQLLVNVRALPEARFGWGVNGGKEFRARPVKPFGRGRPWVRWTRALCKFN